MWSTSPPSRLSILHRHWNLGVGLDTRRRKIAQLFGESDDIIAGRRWNCGNWGRENEGEWENWGHRRHMGISQQHLLCPMSSDPVVHAWTCHWGSDPRGLHLQVRHLTSCWADLPAGHRHEVTPGDPGQERGGIWTRRWDADWSVEQGQVK